MIFDPQGSIGALRHEYRHFLDIKQAGFPGLGPYMMNPKAFYEMEFRGYMEELRFAREQRDFESARAILDQMREEKNYFRQMGMEVF